MARIKHRKHQGYSTVSNVPYDDRRLELEAMGTFQLLWHLPDDWSFNEIDIVGRSASGRTKLRKALNQLEKYGYLKRSRIRNEKGQLTSGDWILDDTGTLGDNSVKAKRQRKSPKKSQVNNYWLWVQKPMFDFVTLAYFEPKTYVTFSNIGAIYQKPMSRFPMLVNVPLLITHSTNYSVSSSKHASKASLTDEKILAKNQSEHSLDDPEGISKAYNLWNDIWGKPSAFVEKQISQWVSEFGLDVVLHAFNYAKWKVERASSAGSYLAKVFSNYRQNNVKTATQADTADKDNLNQSSQRTGKNKPTVPTVAEPSSKDGSALPNGGTKNPSSKDELDPLTQACYAKAVEVGIKLTPADRAQLAFYVHKLGKEVVLYAISVAKRETRYDHPSWGFLNSILNRCLTQGVTKPETRKTATPTYKKRKVIEHTPDWLYKDPTPAELKKSSPQSLAALHKRLAEYKAKKAKKLAGGSTT